LSKKKKARNKRANEPGSGQPDARAQPSRGLPTSRRWPKFVAWLIPIFATTLVAVVLVMRWTRESASPVLSLKKPSTLDAKFVGAAECATCHEQESTRWRGSHHQQAMQPAADATVLGDFEHGSFNNNSIASSFFRNGPKFMVRTDGPDGALHDYEIKYTFGVYPLQQYLIAMPG
jgi:hypothetical protein